MNIQILALCDAATDSGGKLNILGTFDTIVAQSVPVVHPQCAIALRVICWKADEGTHTLQINITDADGSLIVESFKIPMEVTVPADNYNYAKNFIVNLHQLQLEKTGPHSIDVFVDDRHCGGIPFEVISDR